jgi:2-C-methyl-D-erythritol 4-phosphate cytidylyltransferase
MNPHVIAVVLAGGAGSRFGGLRNKSLVPIAGTSVIERSLKQFCAAPSVTQIVLVVKEEIRVELQTAVTSATYSKPIRCVVGGRERQDSVYAGLRACDDLLSPQELEHALILIHDGARCLIRPEVIERMVAGVSARGAVSAAVPVVDALVKTDSEGVGASDVDRAGLWHVQTPQGFRYPIIREAHELQRGKAFYDDASLVRMYHPVSYLQGDRANIKITTAEDLILAEAIVARDLTR